MACFGFPVFSLWAWLVGGCCRCASCALNLISRAGGGWLGGGGGGTQRWDTYLHTLDLSCCTNRGCIVTGLPEGRLGGRGRVDPKGPHCDIYIQAWELSSDPLCSEEIRLYFRVGGGGGGAEENKHSAIFSFLFFFPLENIHFRADLNFRSARSEPAFCFTMFKIKCSRCMLYALRNCVYR